VEVEHPVPRRDELSVRRQRDRLDNAVPGLFTRLFSYGRMCRIRSPLTASQTQTVLSAPPEAMREPSAETATARTSRVCPRSSFRTFPLDESHSRTVPSKPPVTTALPPLANATAATAPRCP
jgi:hypothetical protein